MAIADNEADDLEHLNLPPGYRFHPTDEELIGHYLTQKVLNTDFTATAIGEVDLNKCEPWDLPKKAKMGEKEWYFFCQKDRKYPTGMRTNRATESGYWKATGKDKEIYRKGRGGGGRQLVGMKKTLVFYKGRAPRGEKTNWVMHEFRLEGEFSYKKPKDAEWVVCMVFHKKSGMVKTNSKSDVNSFVEGLLDHPSMPTLIDSSNLNNNEEDFKKRVFTEASVKTLDKNSISYYPTNMNNIYQPQMQPHNNTFNPANYQIDPTSSYQILNSENANVVPYQASSSSPGNYLSQQMINSIPMSFPGQCKVEQFSLNQSMVSRSQDTGLSTDMTTEISPKQEVNRSKLQYEDIEGTSDFESFWSF